MTYRNKALKDSAKGETCVCCGINDGTTVWAHNNEVMFGKGTGHKVSDLLGNYFCLRCHDSYDGRSGLWSREMQKDMFRACYPKTMLRVSQKLESGELKL